MEESNEFCSLCRLHTADLACICINLPVLCENCRQIHQSKPDFHFILPITALKTINSGNQQYYRVLFLSLRNSQQILKANLGTFDRFHAEIETLSTHFHSELAEFTLKLHTELREFEGLLEEKITEAIEETSLNAFKREYQPGSYLGEVLWRHAREHRSDPIDVVRCRVERAGEVEECWEVEWNTEVPELQTRNRLKREREVEELRRKVRENEDRVKELEGEVQELKDGMKTQQEEIVGLREEIDRLRNLGPPIPASDPEPAPVPTSSLVTISGTEVKVCDLIQRKWTAAALTETILGVDAGTRYMWVPGGVYCSGVGSTNANSAFLLRSGREWTVTRLKEMVKPRQFHGLWWDAERNRALSFGDRNIYPTLGRSHAAARKECEQRVFPSDTVSPLPSMSQSRSNFTPCFYHSSLYLCGGNSKSLESFNPQLDLYRPIPLPLPEWSSPYLVFLDNSHLVIMSSHYILRCTASNSQELEQIGLVQQEEIDVRCGGTPVVVAGAVYGAFDGKFFRILVQGSKRREVGPQISRGF